MPAFRDSPWVSYCLFLLFYVKATRLARYDVTVGTRITFFFTQKKNSPTGDTPDGLVASDDVSGASGHEATSV